MPSIQVTPDNPTSPDARQLVIEMVAEIPARYGEALDPAAQAQRVASIMAAQSAFLAPRRVFLMARYDGDLAGCGALQPLAGDAAEVRRMFVRQAMRRRGVGRAILAALEEQAQGFGYAWLRLETGDQQPEALALYAAAGFVRIPPFGNYVDDPTSVCFEKLLPPQNCSAAPDSTQLSQTTSPTI